MSVIKQGGFAQRGSTFTEMDGYAQNLPAGAYTLSTDFGGNIYFNPKEFKTDEILIADDSQSRSIISEIKKFWGMRALYEKHGFMYKRGVLMYGPPGTGKTSTVHTLIDNIVDEHDGVVIMMNDPDTIVEAIGIVLKAQPERHIMIVMEDVEKWYRHHGEELLALLDGGNNTPGVIFLATSNYLEQLPERVRCRPSRFDVVVEINGPTLGVRNEYLISKGVAAPIARQIAELTDGLSFAHLKEIVISHLLFGADPEAAVERVKSVGVIPDDDDDDDEDI